MSAIFDTSGFNAMIAGLSQISGKDYAPVMRDQVGQLMGVCIRYTGSASVGSIQRSVAYQNSPQAKLVRIHVTGRGTVSVDTRKFPGRTWFIEGGKKYIMAGGDPNRHWSDARWNRYLALKNMMGGQPDIDTKTATRSRGLTKETWQQIADDAGAGDRTKAPAYVRNSRTFHGAPAPKIGSATTTSDSSGCFIDIANRSRLLTRGPSSHFHGARESLEGFGILQRAMNARATAFQHETEHEVFSDIEGRAKRYPGIFTTHASV